MHLGGRASLRLKQQASLPSLIIALAAIAVANIAAVALATHTLLVSFSPFSPPAKPGDNVRA